MNKTYLSFLALVGVAGAAIFWQDLAAYFMGMSPLEALKTIVTYLLHLAVGTVAAVVVFGLPKIVQPWMRYFKKHQRNKWRSGPNAQWQPKTPRAPAQKLTATLTMPKQTSPRPSTKQPRKLNIKW